MYSKDYYAAEMDVIESVNRAMFAFNKDFATFHLMTSNSVPREEEKEPPYAFTCEGYKKEGEDIAMDVRNRSVHLKEILIKHIDNQCEAYIKTFFTNNEIKELLPRF